MKKRTATTLLLVGAISVIAYSQTQVQATKWDTRVTASRKAVLDSISADSLKGHLSFIASDALEGRGTPSKGLDVAAEYIAAQFRRAGIQPAVGESYFQMATVRSREGETVPVKNVIGIIPGTDPKLKDTYVLVTAHYDHLGVKAQGEGDVIFNGANDNGSGTVSVIELASVLKSYKPKRTLVFMTFYGEERGLLGARHYAANPVFPLAKTVAMVNLEQVGRTDDGEGPRINAVSMTGQDFSEVGTIFESAGKTLGMGVQKHPRNSDAFFGASDNAALANAGVPAHTVCTAFTFPDYHQVGDHWEKIDFSNMAKVNRLIALGVMTIADSAKDPQWNESNPKTERYRKARQGN